MTALANAASPKAEWRQSFGVEISEADWPCRSLPTALLADRGEMVGASADSLVEVFGVRIETAAPYRADWKGVVERRFGLLHAAFRPFTPGFVEPDFQERGARDYRLDAVLDLDEFTAILTLWEIDQLRQEARRQKRDHAPRQRQGRVSLADEVEKSWPPLGRGARRIRVPQPNACATSVGIAPRSGPPIVLRKLSASTQKRGSLRRSCPSRACASPGRRVSSFPASRASASASPRQRRKGKRMTDEPLLPEYAGNPFIACLPPPLTVDAALAALTDLPGFSEIERSYPAHLRAHCIQRLGQYFDPLTRHLTLEQRIGLLIRQGYLGRNPLTTDYIHRLCNNHERVMRRDLDAPTPHPVETTASGFALIGASGIGKTRSVDRILRLYPQTVAHDEPMALTQVVSGRLRVKALTDAAEIRLTGSSAC